jgi:hypothetical protein
MTNSSNHRTGRHLADASFVHATALQAQRGSFQ